MSSLSSESTQLADLLKVERLGTQYGGWFVPLGCFDASSVCYLAGAGEDVSFDFTLAARTGAEIHIIDPTPRAVEHFDFIREQIEQDPKVAVYNARFGGGDPQYWRHIQEGAKDLSKFKFHSIALAGEQGTLKFYPPKNPEHVSFSLDNLQDTDTPIEVAAETIDSLMTKLGHTKVDLLKLDIEGAEYNVLRQMLAFDILPGVLCIEFDGLLHGRRSVGETQVLLRRLGRAGYHLIVDDGNANHTYVHETALKTLIGAAQS